MIRLPYYREEEVISVLNFLQKDWYFDKLRLAEAHAITRGKGVTIGVLDTGVDDRHIELRKSLLYNKDFTGEGLGKLHPHGTHVAGIISGWKSIMGVAPDATINSYKVLTSTGSGSSNALVAGLRAAKEDGCDIVNLSLGSNTKMRGVEAAIRELVDDGIVVVCAAGNDGVHIDYPAALQETIAVAAADYDTNWFIADFSSPSVGKGLVDTAAPGVKILSSIPDSKYARYSGTSMATPIVSGILALLLSADPEQRYRVNDILRNTSIDIEVKGRDKKSGWGVINPVGVLKGRKISGEPHNVEVPIDNTPSEVTKVGEFFRNIFRKIKSIFS